MTLNVLNSRSLLISKVRDFPPTSIVEDDSTAFCVSPDHRWILYTRRELFASNVMLNSAARTRLSFSPKWCAQAGVWRLPHRLPGRLSGLKPLPTDVSHAKFCRLGVALSATATRPAWRLLLAFSNLAESR